MRKNSWTLLGVCVFVLGAVAVWFWSHGRVSELDKLVENVRSSDEKVRKIAVGKLLSFLKPGMKRTEVEEMIGKGDREWEPEKISEKETRVSVVYYCVIPEKKGTQYMTVEYKVEAKLLIFIKVSGPHYPNSW